MTYSKPYKLLALLLTLSMVGAAASPALAECDSPCCSGTACRSQLERAIPERCDFIPVFVQEIRRPSCNMNKVRTSDAALGTGLTAPRTEPPAPGVHALLPYESEPSSNPSEDPARRPTVLIRAAPDPLYLKNLTLLI